MYTCTYTDKSVRYEKIICKYSDTGDKQPKTASFFKETLLPWVGCESMAFSTLGLPTELLRQLSYIAKFTPLTYKLAQGKANHMSQPDRQSNIAYDTS